MLTVDRLEAPASLPGRAVAVVTRAHVVMLLAILGIGFAQRLTAVSDALHTPGYVWEDPDSGERPAVEVRVPGR